MKGWKDGYIKRIPLTREIQEVVAKAHNLEPSEILVNWIQKWITVKFPTGLIQKTGQIMLRAPGFKPRKYCIYQTKNERWSMN